MPESLFLIVGLGNPGEKYRDTRHNAGFWVIDALAERWKVPSFQSKYKGLFAQTTFAGRPVALLKPQTFMNLSGDSVREAVQFFKIPVESHLLALVDDLDTPAGEIRLRLSGGTGGHNGLKSMGECLSTDGFARLRLGIGRSSQVPPDVHVLSKIAASEREMYALQTARAAEGVELCLKDGVAKAMNTVNVRTDK
ncbi:aminoacyl-tRNA hydrolase [bacterium]|nr:aminoacyl-tRNA hydrolase [bacterium]